MLRLLLAGASSLALSGASSLLPDSSYTFEDFCSDFGRSYEPGTPEYRQRKTIFEARLAEVLAHNADASRTWQRGVNQFSDFSTAEFRASGRLGYSRRLARNLVGQNTANVAATKVASADNVDLPASWDWREKGVVSSVKDQGHCGSCWAFASTATLESHLAIATGSLEVLSPQQLVSCAPNPLHCGGTGGCFGSVPQVAFEYVQLFGMTTEWMYPYTSYYGEASACVSNQTLAKPVLQISGYQKLPPNDYEAVMRALVEVGPLAVNVQADTWSDYHGGVYDGCSNLSNVAIDHVVVLIGYGTDPKLGDYWLVRNSWDATWGEKGYIRLKRSADSECGNDIQPLDGTGCEGGPSSQRVCGQCGVLFDVSYPLGATLLKPERGHSSVAIQI